MTLLIRMANKNLVMNLDIGRDLEVSSKDMLESFLLLASLGPMLLLAVFGGAKGGIVNSQIHSMQAMTQPAMPPPHGSLGYYWGGAQVNYEWGWNDYAYGTIRLTAYANNTYDYSNDTYLFINTSAQLYVTTYGSYAWITNKKYYSPMLVWNTSNQYVRMIVYEGRVTFHATTWFTSNSNTIHIMINMNANDSVTATAQQSGHTWIDWRNILSLVTTIMSVS